MSSAASRAASHLAGNAMLPGYTIPKLLWLKQNEPQNFAQVTSILLPHDYINFWLTGVKRMEYGDASGMGILNVRTRKWSRELCDFIDPRTLSMLPPLGSSQAVHGTLRPELAKKWGLSDNGDRQRRRRRQHDGRDRHRQHQARRHHRQLRHQRHALRRCRRTGGRRPGRSRRLLRQQRPVAPARLHHECHRRHRAGARDVRLEHPAARSRRCQRSRRSGRRPFPALSQRRAHPEPAQRHRRPPRPAHRRT